MADKQEPKNIITEMTSETPDFTNMPELKAYAGPLQQQYERALDFRKTITDRHQQELEEIDAQIAKIGGVLKALGEEVPTPRFAAKKSANKSSTGKKTGKAMPSMVLVRRASGTPTGFGISLEAAASAADKIKEIAADGKQFTQKDAYRAMEWDQSKGSACFRYLESIGFIVMTGRNSDSGRAALYQINDPDAIEKAFVESDRVTKEFQEQHGKGKVSA